MLPPKICQWKWIGFRAPARVLNFWSYHNPHASSLKIREVWCRNLNLAYRVRNLLLCRLRRGVASCTWNALLCLFCALSISMSPIEQTETSIGTFRFSICCFSLLFVGSSEHSGLWSLNKSEKASGACLVFLRNLPSFLLKEWLL